jgi:hypothetical protein
LRKIALNFIRLLLGHLQISSSKDIDLLRDEREQGAATTLRSFSFSGSMLRLWTQRVNSDWRVSLRLCK